MSPQRKPPHDLAAEQSVIATCLLQPDRIDDVAEHVSEADWYDARHAAVWRTLCEAVQAGEVPDSVTLRRRLEAAQRLAQAGGDEYLLSLTDKLPEPARVEQHAKAIAALARARRLADESAKIAAAAYGSMDDVDGYLEDAEARVFAVTQDRPSAGSYVPVGEVVVECFEQVKAAHQRGHVLRGLPTGFPALDKKTTGMHPGQLIVIAGRPGMGKTAFALNLCENLADSGEPSLVFSMEMSRTELVNRLLSSRARIDGQKLREARISNEEMARAVNAAGEVHPWRLYIDDRPGLSIPQMRAAARRCKRKHGLSAIVVDYLQLARSGEKTDGREGEVAAISRGLKGIAKELGVPVVALAQLNRSCESRDDKRPVIRDLRESGHIEQDSDVIGFLYRDEVYNPEAAPGVAECIIAKQRGGPTGKVRLRFFREYTRFVSLAEEPDPDDDEPRYPSGPAAFQD